MFKFLRKHRTILMVTLAACVIGLPFFGIGGSSLMSSPHDTLAKVNGEKITQFHFDRLYHQALRQQTDLKPEDQKRLTQEVFNELVRQAAFYQEAKSYGIVVSGQELQIMLANMTAFHKDGKFDPRIYYQTITQVYDMSPDQFEKMRSKDIAGRKLNQLIASAVHIQEEDVQAALQRRLAIETDPEEKKKLMDDPSIIRKELREQEINQVFGDWLSQLNTKLKVNIVSNDFRKRLSS
ncbi:hypothetical protein BVX98_00140 [bacterium F11]|nr:hypothetical protein BVX98_00140 [bacterium F11]